jgi:hypothetical protein
MKWCVGENEGTCHDLKVRTLYVDSRPKEFTVGTVHDVTERVFVVRRGFRVNDSLPGETASPARWLWQRGGWLMVDRITGHVSAISLPEFDSYYSLASGTATMSLIAASPMMFKSNTHFNSGGQECPLHT